MVFVTTVVASLVAVSASSLPGMSECPNPLNVNGGRNGINGFINERYTKIR